MSESSQHRSTSPDGADDQQQLDVLRSRLASAWESGGTEAARRLLDEIDGDHRRDAFRALIQSMLALTETNASGINRDDLRVQFPDLTDIIDSEVDALGQTAVVETGADLQEVSGWPLPDDMPRELGRYRLQCVLGRGGMGTVFLARDTVLKRRVAIKVPRFDGTDADAMIARFHREARTMAAVKHPNLCTVHDIDEIDGFHCLTMEYVEGESLSERLKRESKLPVDESIRLIATLARALQPAHDAGVIHRDLKPSNVLLRTSGEPVLTDFGLARPLFPDQSSSADGNRTLTASGTILGTPLYMSPEQVEGKRNATGPATDTYSLGVMLYQLITGRLPFDGSVGQVLSSIVTQPPAPPSRHSQDLDPRLDAICLQALAKNPAERFASASRFAEVLESYLNDSPLTACSRAKWKPWTAIAAGLLLIAGLVMLIYSGNGAEQEVPGDQSVDNSIEDETAGDGPQIDAVAELSPVFESAGGLINDRFAWCPLFPMSDVDRVSDKLLSLGYGPVEFRPAAGKSGLVVAMIWSRDASKTKPLWDLTLESFREEDKRQKSRGATIRSLVCYQPELNQWSSDAATWRFSAIWTQSEQSSDWRYYESVYPPADQNDATDPLYAQGWRPVAFSGFVQRPTMAGLCQIWQPDVAGWAFIRPTLADRSLEDEQRQLGRHPVQLFLATWPPNVILMQYWRDLSGIESTVVCHESVADHLRECRRLASAGWYPVSVCMTPIVRGASEPATGSIWHRKVESKSGP